jgi:glycerol-3-phosphate dehydrogenase
VCCVVSCFFLFSNGSPAGTSSRSTKLIHGGMRYLEKAFLQLDYGQYKLVHEALSERAFFFRAAPHLARPLPILLPVYDTFPAVLFYAPYYWIGCKACAYGAIHQSHCACLVWSFLAPWLI